MQRGTLHILFLFFNLLFIYFLGSGGGSVPFVHFRKYAPEDNFGERFGDFRIDQEAMQFVRNPFNFEGYFSEECRQFLPQINIGPLQLEQTDIVIYIK